MEKLDLQGLPKLQHAGIKKIGIKIEDVKTNLNMSENMGSSINTSSKDIKMQSMDSKQKKVMLQS